MEGVTILDRLLADFINFAILGAGMGLLVSIIIAAILTKVKAIRDLVTPGKEAIDTAAEWVRRMREMDRDPDRDYQMSDLDKQVFSQIVLGLAIRNGLVVLAITLLVGQLATGGM